MGQVSDRNWRYHQKCAAEHRFVDDVAVIRRISPQAGQHGIPGIGAPVAQIHDTHHQLDLLDLMGAVVLAHFLAQLPWHGTEIAGYECPDVGHGNPLAAVKELGIHVFEMRQFFLRNACGVGPFVVTPTAVATVVELCHCQHKLFAETRVQLMLAPDLVNGWRLARQ